MFENKSKREGDVLNEYRLNDLISENFPRSQEGTITAISDDASVIDSAGGSGSRLVLGSCTLVENIHFDLAYVPLKHLGYKSIVVAMSRIVAMNAQPTHVLLNVSVSNRFSMEAMEAFYSGVQSACANYKVDLVVNEITNSPKGMSIGVTCLGRGIEGEILYRKGAQEGDLIVVSGDLGAAYLGLQLLEREKSIFLERPEFQPDLEGNDYILQRQLRPEARVDIRPMLTEKSIVPTAMTNINYGLTVALDHICRQSSIGADLYEHKFPIDPQTYQRAIDFGIDPTVACLDGGDDYELLFTIGKDHYTAVENSPDLTVIGHCTANGEGLNLVSKSNKVHEIRPRGWTK